MGTDTSELQTRPAAEGMRPHERRQRGRSDATGFPGVRSGRVAGQHSVVPRPLHPVTPHVEDTAVSMPVVLIAEELSPATVEALGPDFEIRHCNGADRAELLAAIADVDAILVRSATKVDAEALAAATRLKVVARAGVGLDNVDVRAATQAGVMVVNAPTSNIVSAAELAVALMLAAARHVSPAHAALKNGEWKRSNYTGIELYEKTVGIVGLGRIGVLVAQRLSGVRHEGHRLRPLRAGRPRRPDGRPPGRPRHAARRGRLHVGAPAQDARDRSA